MLFVIAMVTSTFARLDGWIIVEFKMEFHFILLHFNDLLSNRMRSRNSKFGDAVAHVYHNKYDEARCASCNS